MLWKVYKNKLVPLFTKQALLYYAILTLKMLTGIKNSSTNQIADFFSDMTHDLSP